MRAAAADIRRHTIWRCSRIDSSVTLASLGDAKVTLESIREQRQMVWRRMSAAAART